MPSPNSKTTLAMSELLALETLELKAKRIVAGLLEGIHKSFQTGYNVEFKEYREYVPGNDAKQIDWKLFCRTDRLYLKLRESETQVNGSILIDRSGSMDFRGDRAQLTKWEYAQQIAAALLLFLSRQRDPVSLGIAGDTLESYFESSLHPETIRGMISELDNTPASGTGDLRAVSERALRLLKPQSLVFIISDFYSDVSAIEESVTLLSAKGCECFILQIVDPVEVDFDIEEDTTLVDLETETETAINPVEIKEEYLAKFNQQVDALQRLALKNQGVFLQLKTDSIPIDRLAHYLLQREAMS